MEDMSNLARAMTLSLNYAIEKSGATTVQSVFDQLEKSKAILLQIARNSGKMGDRTLLSLRALCKIYSILAKKIDYQADMNEVIQQIIQKGVRYADHIGKQSQMIRQFAYPHFREGMVSQL